MLVNIVQDFEFNNQHYYVGMNPNIPADLGRQWIAEGRAELDINPGLQRRPVFVADEAVPVSASSEMVVPVFNRALPPGDRVQLVPASQFGSAVSTDPEVSGTSIRAITLLSDEEKAEVRNPAIFPTIDLAPKIQAWLDSALNVYGDGLTGSGGRGCRIEFDAGNWLVSHLDLRPGVQFIGLSSREEVQFVQKIGYNADHFITILGHLLNGDAPQRRTEVLIQDVSFDANGLLDAAGDPLDCMHAEPEVFGDTDPDDAVTRTGVIGHRFSCSGASGYGYNSQKRGKNWLHECQFTGNGKSGHENACGGLYVQGPDSKFEKVYCGSNWGHQIHIKSSETPMIYDVELGTTKSNPEDYVSLYSELCTSLVVIGGNSTGPFLIEGGEGDTAANEYGVHSWINISDVIFTFKDKTFTNTADSTIKVQPGYIRLKNIKGVYIDCRYHPAFDEVDGSDPMVHTVSHRPTNVLYVQGARSSAVLRIAPPPVDDVMWLAGAPEDSPSGPPTDPYATLTNKKDQVTIQLIDTTIDATASRFHRIGAIFNDRLEILGQTEQAGSIVVPKTVMTTVIDVTKARNYATPSTDVTLTFSNATPQDGTLCGMEVKATGADRTLTLPASVVDVTSGVAVTSFLAKQNKRYFVTLLYLNANWLIGGYPYDSDAVLAASPSYANDTAAAAGGVAIGAEYRNGSFKCVRVT